MNLQQLSVHLATHPETPLSLHRLMQFALDHGVHAHLAVVRGQVKVCVGSPATIKEPGIDHEARPMTLIDYVGTYEELRNVLGY